MVPIHGELCGGLFGGAQLKFWKVEAIGNDFPLLHLDDLDPATLPALAEQLCDRRFGIGGDGLLAVGMEGEVLRVRMFNPDGTEDFCGNGLRCAAHHARLQGWVGPAFDILHLGQTISTRIEGDRIETVLGVASYDPAVIPTAFDVDPEVTFDRIVWSDGVRKIRGSVLSTGTTHTIVPGALPSEEEFQYLGPRIEVAPQFPARTSIMWTEEVAPFRLRLRIWERGVGETQGCGSGSTAAAVDYFRRQNRGGTVEVVNPGGSLWISAEAWNSPVTVKGNAHQVFEGVLPA